MVAFGTMSPAGPPRRIAHPWSGWWRLCLSLLTPAFAAEQPKPAAPAPNSTAACLECHSDETLTMKKAGQKLLLFIDEKVTAKSAHRSLGCIDCHEKFDGESTPHLKPMSEQELLEEHPLQLAELKAQEAAKPAPPPPDPSLPPPAL